MAILEQLQRQGVVAKRLTADSRRVTPGDVFVAFPGAQVDGRNFIAQAVAQGAAAVLAEAGSVFDRAIVATTVHPIQIVRENLPITSHDIPVDLIVTPRAAIEVERAFDRPRGILWDHLQPPQIHEIPVLERMGYLA